MCHMILMTVNWSHDHHMIYTYIYEIYKLFQQYNDPLTRFNLQQKSIIYSICLILNGRKKAAAGIKYLSQKKISKNFEHIMLIRCPNKNSVIVQKIEVG